MIDEGAEKYDKNLFISIWQDDDRRPGAYRPMAQGAYINDLGGFV